MRQFRLLILCAGLLLALHACSSDDTSSSLDDTAETSQQAPSSTSYETDPVPAPDVSMETMDGQVLNLAEQKGKVVLVNFWATWCGPCRREIPDLIELYDDLKGKGLVIVGIAVDQEGAEVVDPFVEEEQINYPIVVDPKQSLEKHFEAMYGLPTTYVVNPEGKIVRRVLGVFPVEDMRPELKDMLSEGDAST